MKARFVITIGVLLVNLPAFAQSSGLGAGSTVHRARHVARDHARRVDNRMGSRVSVGSDVRITPTGEVIAPAMQVLSVPSTPPPTKPAQP